MSIPVYPTPSEVHAQLLRTLRYLYADAGITVNLRKKSELWYRMKAVAERISIAISNGKAELQNTNPLKAVGQALLTWAATFGVFPRPASKASGFVICTVLLPAITVAIPAGYRCQGANGVLYETPPVPAVQNVTDHKTVQVQAVLAGSDGDLAAGSVVTWTNTTVAFLGQNATIAAGGIDGGAPEDTEEVLRARLLRRLAFPGVGGNWSQVAEFAEASSAAVVFAAVYPAIGGPASYGVAIMGEPHDPVLNVTNINAAAEAIVAELPGHSRLNTTSISQQELDVLCNLGLPLPVSVGGVGGGWKDAEPYPSTADAGAGLGAIDAVNTATKTITVNSPAGDTPVAFKRIAIWDEANVDSLKDPDPQMREFTILNVAGVAGAWILTLDTSSVSMGFITTDMYVSAAAHDLQSYARALWDAVNQLGPGEKTDDPDLLNYARRRPGPDIERPYDLTTRQLGAVENKFSEITNLSFAARYETGTANTRTSPAIPATTANAPRQLTLKHLSFRRQV